MREVRLGPGDERVAHQLFVTMASVFEEAAGEPIRHAYVARLLGSDSFWAIAAFDGQEMVGGLTAHTLPLTRAESSEIFIYDIAVRAEHRRRGVGRRLVEHLRREAAAVGIHDVFVPADDDDDAHALEFYRALGGDPAAVTIFTFARRA